MNTRNQDHDWATVLVQFTVRNAGRVTALEEHDSDLGAQKGEQGIELRGVSFDPHDRSVAIMLGALHGAQGHLTHVVRDVEAIDVLKSDDGRDLALRLARPNGQTLLRFDSA